MTSYLLDTHVLLWAADAPQRLSAETRAAIDDPRNDVAFSVINLWEVSIKTSLKRWNFSVDAAALRQAALGVGFAELPVRGAHVLEVSRLPAHHADPFDRMLVAQAVAEGMTLLTVDRAVLRYGSPVTPA